VMAEDVEAQELGYSARLHRGFGWGM
jgi:hypothetical protein